MELNGIRMSLLNSSRVSISPPFKCVYYYFPLFVFNLTTMLHFWSSHQGLPTNPIIFSSVKLPPLCLFILLGYGEYFL